MKLSQWRQCLKLTGMLCSRRSKTVSEKWGILKCRRFRTAKSKLLALANSHYRSKLRVWSVKNWNSCSGSEYATDGLEDTKIARQTALS